MRKAMYVQYTTMIVLCFVCGVAIYQLFHIEQVKQIIEWGDRRLLTLDKPTLIWSAVPFIVAISIVLFFSTHKYLTVIAPVFIAIKLTFLGFSSVFLLVQHQSVKFYGLWWFPFQLFYCILLIVLYNNCFKNNKINGRALKATTPWRKVIQLLLVMILLFGLENFVISYLFK
ncbi:MAG: hypothetical protein ABS944_02105 [Solibacillus sp.]|uniref:hypothetical protein n=1 Tax=unclassified Solibacillus TaxID=2637870 RepID=UPI0030FBF5DB